MPRMVSTSSTYQDSRDVFHKTTAWSFCFCYWHLFHSGGACFVSDLGMMSILETCQLKTTTFPLHYMCILKEKATRLPPLSASVWGNLSGNTNMQISI